MSAGPVAAGTRRGAERQVWAARAVLGGRIAERVRLRARSGRIDGVEIDVPPESGEERLDDGWLCPGLVDLQVNGAAGVAFDDPSPEARAGAVAWHLERGTTTLLATLVSAPVATLEAALGRLAPEARSGGPVTGVHLEGPFLSAEKAGAHAADALAAPTPEAAERLLAASEGSLRMLTLAPELPGALELVERFARAGVVVAAGHTRATRDQLLEAVERGLSFVTHLGNACEWPSRPFDPELGYRRSEPGVIGTFLFERRLRASVILDGRHLDPDLVRALVELRGTDGLVLVSDAAPFAGVGPGEYSGGGLSARVHTEGFATSGQGLAGSTIPLLDAVRLAVARLRLSLPEALAMATTTPARVAGLAGKGELAAGRDADWIALGGDLSLRAVVSGGLTLERRARTRDPAVGGPSARG